MIILLIIITDGENRAPFGGSEQGGFYQEVTFKVALSPLSSRARVTFPVRIPLLGDGKKTCPYYAILQCIIVSYNVM